MKKILYIHHATAWGGAPINLINIINSLDKEKYSVEILLIKNSPILKEKFKENNIPFSVASSWFYRKFYKYYSHTETNSIKWYLVIFQIRQIISWVLSYLFFAKKELKKLDFDIVHLNSSVLSDWVIPCKQKGRVVVHIQETLAKGSFGIRNKFLKNNYNKADKIIAISKDCAGRINLAEKTEIIYNYSDIENTKEQNIDFYNTKRVLYIGGAAKIKGFQTIVKSLDYLDNDIKIYFGGYYPLLNIKLSLKQKIKKYFFKERYSITEDVSFMRNHKSAIEIGLIDNINEYLDKSVCLVSPFLLPHFSRPIIEAFGRRKPAISTNIDGIEEVVSNNIDGLVVENNDYIALAKAINYLCQNPSITKKMGDNAYIKANKLFSESNVLQYENVYYDLLRK